MKKKVQFLYLLFLLVQLFLPFCVTLGYLLGKPFVLAVPELSVLVLAGFSVYITKKIGKQQSFAFLLPLPVSILNGAFLLLEGSMGGIAAFVCIGCGWALLRRVPKGWLWGLCYGLSALACAAMILVLPLWGFVQVMRRDHVVNTYPSPEGGYRATVIISDQGALGGETRVTVRNEEKSIHILVGCFEDSETLWRGEFAYAQEMELQWESEEVLNINGVSYAVSGEDVPLLAMVSQTLETTILRGGVLRSWETHGGFHGDGETYVELYGDCSIPDSPFWHSLPAPAEFEKLAANCRDDNDAVVIPPVSKGYWFFQNRHPKANDPAAMENHGSWNYTLAVYDAESNILYFYKLDT